VSSRLDAIASTNIPHHRRFSYLESFVVERQELFSDGQRFLRPARVCGGQQSPAKPHPFLLFKVLDDRIASSSSVRRTLMMGMTHYKTFCHTYQHTSTDDGTPCI
jgi:hypothetical protein